MYFTFRSITHVDGMTSFVGNEATSNGGISRSTPPLGPDRFILAVEDYPFCFVLR